MSTEVTIYISEEDARHFVLFQKHYEVFKALLESKVFEQKKATIALNFDHEGVLQSIQRADFLYTKKHGL